MSQLCLSVLGGFEARMRGRHSKAELTFPTRKSEALLAYLAVKTEPRHRRDHLCDLLWGDVPVSQARHSLRQTLRDIRAAVDDTGHNLLITVEDTVELNARRVWLDANSFERLLQRGTPRSVAAGCSLYRGDFLEGFNIREAGFENWVSLERIRLKQRAIEASESHMRTLMAAGRTTDAIQAALRLAALDPLQERVHRALMTLYLQRGQLSAALNQYEFCVRLLARELGIAPEAETTRLWREIRAGRERLSGGVSQDRTPEPATQAQVDSRPLKDGKPLPESGPEGPTRRRLRKSDPPDK